MAAEYNNPVDLEIIELHEQNDIHWIAARCEPTFVLSSFLSKKKSCVCFGVVIQNGTDLVQAKFQMALS